jgi:hypothetical protein
VKFEQAGGVDKGRTDRVGWVEVRKSDDVFDEKDNVIEELTTVVGLIELRKWGVLNCGGLDELRGGDTEPNWATVVGSKQGSNLGRREVWEDNDTQEVVVIGTESKTDNCVVNVEIQGVGSGSDWTILFGFVNGKIVSSLENDGVVLDEDVESAEQMKGWESEVVEDEMVDARVFRARGVGIDRGESRERKSGRRDDGRLDWEVRRIVCKKGLVSEECIHHCSDVLVKMAAGRSRRLFECIILMTGIRIVEKSSTHRKRERERKKETSCAVGTHKKRASGIQYVQCKRYPQQIAVMILESSSCCRA